MKKQFLLVAWMLITAIVYAQPSKTEMLDKIKSDYKESLLSVDLVGDPRTEHIWENGSWKDYFRQSYRAKFSTKYQGVSLLYSGSIQYIKAGNTYEKIVGF